MEVGSMAILYQKDKRSGITYAYESISHWDKEKKQSRAKRTLIGRLDTIMQTIILSSLLYIFFMQHLVLEHNFPPIMYCVPNKHG